MSNKRATISIEDKDRFDVNISNPKYIILKPSLIGGIKQSWIKSNKP